MNNAMNMPENKYDLNSEQLTAISAKSPTLVNASAGSGKTRCLVAKAQSLLDSGVHPRNILAVTFTNKAANEMKERLKRAYKGDLGEMQVSTIHSMGVRIIKKFPGEAGLRVPFSIYDDSESVAVIKTLLKARKIADDPYTVMSSISRAKGDQAEDQLDGYIADIYEQYQKVLKSNNAVDFDDLLIYAYEVLLGDAGSTYFSDLWKHILVDEVQDTSRLQYGIILSLYNPQQTKTLFMVGDTNQCLVAGTIIQSESKRTIESISAGDTIKVAAGNNKVVSRPVNKIYSREVKNLPVVTIKTESGLSLTSTYEHMHFAGFERVPEQEKDTRHYVYLMFREDLGYRVGVTKDVRGGGKRYPLVHGYKIRCSGEKADALWILGIFDSESKARYHEHFYSIKYGIPTWIFHTSYRQLKIAYCDEDISRLFHNLDTTTGALKLLGDLGLFIDFPHHVPKCMSKKRRRNFAITLCGDIRGYHRYALSGSSEEDQLILSEMGFKTRASKARGFRLEGVSTDLQTILEIKDRIEQKLKINVIQSAHFTKGFSLPMTPASHVLPGMTCFIEKEGEICTSLITEVIKGIYTGTLHDLDIPVQHNYIANGIVTHNSIYGFRGARPSNMQDFIQKYNPEVINLTYNYRSCPSVIAHANGYLQYGKAMVAKSENTGKVSVTVFRNQEEEAEKIAEALRQMGGYDQTAIIYRMNSRSLQFERAFVRHNIPYKVAGHSFMNRRISKDLMAFLKASRNPSDMESFLRVVNVPKRGFGETKQERFMHEGMPYLKAMATEMPAIDEFLKMLTDISQMKPMEAVSEVLNRTRYRVLQDKNDDKDMVDAFLDASSGYETIDEMILAASFLERDSGRGVNLVTGHASKGLEWDRVFVVGVESEVWPHKLSTDLSEEERLYYVAVTRARRYLNISYSKSRTYRGKAMDSYPSALFNKSFRTLTGKPYSY